ncbi:MAG: hypothetical protein A3F54_04580 [Candidatus Kerfeldbacteria bacterium RIFCSPHIGHO2_12_FULL_48_17]|uniref:Uncharacterized protein n=1 Tax=Candidatus Kerfeldbacteria bacterium RIFCSPHIGHO2_12_FULL_48_17 TaxID=1798542 RepID=A0A1G2B172_9BACT|nr:MAG: hypothetical protein A3F54_04580 [Candidatus Kerfeldbacteria bacterium RIFCSPHIGHO2_12_FULL_48_17]
MTNNENQPLLKKDFHVFEESYGEAATAIQKDLTCIQEQMVTKEDLKQHARKEDLQQMEARLNSRIANTVEPIRRNTDEIIIRLDTLI